MFDGANLFSYCRNDPINQSDLNGCSSITLTNPSSAKLQLARDEIGCGGGTALFWGRKTSILTGSYSLLVAPIISLVASGISSISKSTTKDQTITDPEDIAIYRYNGTNPSNLTPRPKDITGLSFSTIPKPGAAETTINTVNATGILHAEKDGPHHVSVTPVGVPMQEWIAHGSNSLWTKTLKKIVTKWKGL